jgi:thioredoxin-related protein
MKLLGLALSVSVLLLGGCGENTSEAKKIEAPAPAAQKSGASAPAAPAAEAPTPKRERKTEEPKAASTPKAAAAPDRQAAQLSAFYRVFKDGAKIAPEGKPLLLVFGQPADPYTQKLQKEVTENEALAAKIKATTTPVYVNAASAKVHKFMHEGELMDVDTRTLVSIYGVDSTPTLIFMDEEGKSIFVVPGYMPPKQFLVTLDFVREGAWKGKDRKNGEVYEALKAYYLSHGVEIGGAEKEGGSK